MADVAQDNMRVAEITQTIQKERAYASAYCRFTYHAEETKHGLCASSSVAWNTLCSATCTLLSHGQLVCFRPSDRDRLACCRSVALL